MAILNFIKWAGHFAAIFAAGLVNFQTPAAYANPATEKTEVLIIGAGLSGLTAAYELKKKGIASVILEAAPRIGGRVRTVTYQRTGETSFTADSGMEEYWESNPAVGLLKELKLPVRSDIASSSLRLDGRLELLAKDETGPEFLARILSAHERAALERLKKTIEEEIRRLEPERSKISRKHPLVKESFAAWVARLKPPKRVAELVRISLECEIGTSWNRISAVDAFSEFHIFLGEAGGEKSFRVIGGNQKFTDALAHAVGPDRIRLNHYVKEVRQSEEGASVSYLEQATQRAGSIQARYVISTVPLFRLSEIQFDPPLSALKKEAIGSQAWGSYFKAHFLFPKKSARFWSKEGNSFLPLLTDSALGVIYEGNPDHPGPTRVLSLLITGDHAEAFNWMSQDEARKKLTEQLEALWPGSRQEILETHLYRYHPRAIAAWPVGRSRHDELSRAIREPEQKLFLAGDFTEGTHSSGAVESANRVVRQIESLERSRKAVGL